jgi:hypothetical protein
VEDDYKAKGIAHVVSSVPSPDEVYAEVTAGAYTHSC